MVLINTRQTCSGFSASDGDKTAYASPRFISTKQLPHSNRSMDNQSSAPVYWTRSISRSGGGVGLPSRKSIGTGKRTVRWTRQVAWVCESKVEYIGSAKLAESSTFSWLLPKMTGCPKMRIVRSYFGAFARLDQKSSICSLCLRYSSLKSGVIFFSGLQKLASDWPTASCLTPELEL